MSLFQKRIQIKTSLSKPKHLQQGRNYSIKKRGILPCTCQKASLMVETAAILPFFACLLVFFLYFFRILQVQTAVVQALQYSGRTIAAQCSLELTDIIAIGKKEAENTGESEQENAADKADNVADFAKAQLLFRSQLKKQDCPEHFISYGYNGISLLQSQLSGDYVELKAVYRMKLPVGLLGNIQYTVVQEAKCRKWTGYQLGQDEEQDDTWLYYTPYGTVYHTSRQCAYLDLSIHSVLFSQVGSARNQNGANYYGCEQCAKEGHGSMVYITDYGDRYHTSLNCSALKRTVYMIRRSEAFGKRLCKKCGGS